MKSEYHPNRWLRILDMVGMVIAPISFSLPIFLWTIQGYKLLRSNGNSYIDFIILFFGIIVILISLVSYFGRALKLYVNHQVTRDDVMVFRTIYSGFILGSLIVYFVFFF